ncbi:MAG TPA: hypothetical protein VM260_27470, partial [Pirellula sp.]|nr:hypothetical protein [Pirellula sp.]
YDALTVLPDARASYSKADFIRDVHLLATSAVRQTSTGATVVVTGATGAVGNANAFVVVPPTGMPVYYSGIRFEDDN